ncbi:MAG TPA: hypothetical protein VJV78_32855 [Polyangiales bacterium]|nr:hypothetical protein [Polyangiales bacterium]
MLLVAPPEGHADAVGHVLHAHDLGLVDDLVAELGRQRERQAIGSTHDAPGGPEVLDLEEDRGPDLHERQRAHAFDAVGTQAHATVDHGDEAGRSAQAPQVLGARQAIELRERSWWRLRRIEALRRGEVLVHASLLADALFLLAQRILERRLFIRAEQRARATEHADLLQRRSPRLRHQLDLQLAAEPDQLGIPHHVGRARFDVQTVVPWIAHGQDATARFGLGLEQLHRMAAQRELARAVQPGEPATHDDHRRRRCQVVRTARRWTAARHECGGGHQKLTAPQLHHPGLSLVVRTLHFARRERRGPEQPATAQELKHVCQREESDQERSWTRRSIVFCSLSY